MSRRSSSKRRTVSIRSISVIVLGSIMAFALAVHLVDETKYASIAGESALQAVISQSSEASTQSNWSAFSNMSDSSDVESPSREIDVSEILHRDAADAQRLQLRAEQKAQLKRYAEATARYFTSPLSNDLEAGFAHAFFGEGKFLVHQEGRWFWDEGTWKEESWNLTRGYGSHVNLNEVTLRFVSLAAAYKMNWLGYIPEDERYNQSWGQALIGLKTLRTMQISGDQKQFYRGHFHRTYLTTIEKNGSYDVDRSAEEISRPEDENVQSSDDNGLALMNLLVLEGMAGDSSVEIKDRQEIIELCREIRQDIDLRDFLEQDKIVQYIRDGVQSRESWDRLSSEGQIILAAMLVSGQISEGEFYEISKSLKNYPAKWRSFDCGTIEIDKPSYHSAAFLHSLRTIHGMPATEEEFEGVDFYDTSTLPVLKAHIDYSEHYGLKALGTQVMTQSLYGTPIFSMNGRQVQFPGNERNSMPVPGRTLSRATGPHAWFVPLARWRHLSEGETDEMLGWASSYEREFFHTGSDADLGWEAAIPWEPKDRTYAWRASDGTWRYTDWGRPYEALNSAYTLLSIFDALNPDAPLASYNIEAEKIKYIARYFDCGAALPKDAFARQPDLADEQNYEIVQTESAEVSALGG